MTSRGARAEKSNPWESLGLTEEDWRGLAGAFYALAHNDFTFFENLPASLQVSTVGLLCSRYIETGNHEFVEEAGRALTGTRHWFVYLGRRL